MSGPPPIVQSRVLNRLALEPGKVIPRHELISAAYHDDPEAVPRFPYEAIGGAILRLRRKGAPIVTVYDQGFMLTPSAS